MSQVGSTFPADLVGSIAVGAVDRMHQNAFIVGFFQNRIHFHRALGERLVSGYENHSQRSFTLLPLQAIHGRADDPGTVLVATVGLQSEENLAQAIQIVGKGSELADVSFISFQRTFPILVQSDLDARALALILGFTQLVDDRPEFGLCLVDQA